MEVKTINNSIVLPGTGNENYYTVRDQAIENQIKPYLESFNNVTFEGVYTVAANINRYVFKVAGFNNLLLFVQPYSSNTAGISIGVCTKAQKSTNSSLSEMQGGACSRVSSHTESGVTYYIYTYSNGNVYTFSENEVLKAIGMGNTGNNPNVMPWLVQSDESYVYYNNTYLYPDSGNGSYTGVYTNAPYNSLDGKVLSRNALVVDSATSNSNLIGQLEELYQFAHRNFSTMGFHLIEVEGVKYRQAGANGIFIKN